LAYFLNSKIVQYLQLLKHLLSLLNMTCFHLQNIGQVSIIIDHVFVNHDLYALQYILWCGNLCEFNKVHDIVHTVLQSIKRTAFLEKIFNTFTSPFDFYEFLGQVWSFHIEALPYKIQIQVFGSCQLEYNCPHFSF
jgi:hypothetical protein